MAADLKRQRSELERTQRLEAWADMARQVAHDIKNPLTPIQLSAEHAQRVNIDRGRPLSPVLDECVSGDPVAGQAAAADLRRVLQLRLVADAAARADRAAGADRGGRRAVPHRPGGPHRDRRARAGDCPMIDDRPHAVRARAHQRHRERAACHARDRTARPPSVRTGVEDGPGGIHARPWSIEITDTGIGMDEEAMDKIFEPYFSTKATGTGLGLTIAKRNVELNGGTIQVRSQKGVGTTVTMTFPVDPEPPSCPPGPEKRFSTYRDAAAGNPVRFRP